MMRNTWLLLLAITVGWFGCDNAKQDGASGFKIEAEFRGLEDNTMISLHRVTDGQVVQLDSQFLDDSSVSFKGVLDQPDMIYLKIGDSRQAINIFAENSQITASVNVDSLDKAVIKDSSVHDDLMDFKRIMQMFDEK